MALSRKNRLTTKKDIDRVFKNGRTVNGSFLFIRLLENQQDYSRMAFIVPVKYIKRAVDRNKAKRVMSEEVRKNPIVLKRGYDIVVVLSKKVEKEKIGLLTDDLRQALVKAGFIGAVRE